MDEIDPDPDNIAPMVSCGEINEEVPPHTPVDCRKIITYSRRTGTGLPMPLQPYQTPSDEPCNADRSDPASTRTSGKPDGDNTTGRPMGCQNYVENNHVVASSIVNPDLQLRLTRQKIARDLVSEDFAMYLGNLENTDEAICLHLRELGIDIDAWEEAVDTIGWYDAFLSICVINRNRFHPTTPVLSSGGTLRGFTFLCRARELNLTRSILSILERTFAGTQAPAKVRSHPDA